MRDGPCETRRRTMRELRVGVEGENVPDLRQRVETAGFDGECVELACKQLIQVEQLATLALPTHPHALTRIKDPIPMQHHETAVILRWVFGIQLADKPDCEIDEGVRIVAAGLASRVGEIGEQREMQVAIAIG